MLMVLEDLHLKLNVQLVFVVDDRFHIFLTTVTPYRAAVLKMKLDVLIII